MHRRIFRWFSLLALVVLASPARGTDYHVDGVSGSNQTGNGSATSPWRTITHALSQIPQPGPTEAHRILLRPAVYNLALGETLPIYMRPKISIVGLDRQRVVLELMGGGAIMFRAPGWPPTYVSYSYDTVLSDLTIRTPGPGAHIWVYGAPGGTSPVLRRITFESGTGIWLMSPDPQQECLLAPLIIDCTFLGEAGIFNGGVFCSPAPLIVNCVFDGLGTSRGPAIYCSIQDPRGIFQPVFLNNTVTRHAEGVRFDSGLSVRALADRTLFINCVISGNQVDLQDVGRDQLWFCNFNTWRRTPTQNPFPEPDPGVNGNLAGDPRLRDPARGDLRLEANSPLIDRGWDPPFGLPPFDPEGEPRRSDGNGDGLTLVDIGADEVPRTLLATPLPAQGIARFTIDAPASAGLPYFAAASFASSPGFRVDTRLIPLEPDPLFHASLANREPFQAFQGVLDPSGRATMRLQVPPPLWSARVVLVAAFVTLHPGAPSSIRDISNVAVARLAPP